MFAIGAGTATAPHRGPAATLVEMGKPTAVVVVADEPGPEVSFAAGELCDYIQRISGASLKVHRGGRTEGMSGRAEIEIAIDESLRRTLGEDGFVVRVGPTGVKLRGATGTAAVYAVYAFLEEQLGCRWFLPVELGEDIPKSSTLVIRAMEKQYRPSLRFRHIGGVSHLGWDLKNRLSERLRIGAKQYGKVWGIAHTFYALLPMEEYWKEHPEYYALINGKRRGPVRRVAHGPQFCTSNPEVTRQVARQINTMFDEDPSLLMITLGPNDGLLFCECPACQALDEPSRPWRGAGERTQWRGQLSRRMMLFYNAVARLVKAKHPDKLLKVMVYSWYQEPPSDRSLKFESNILVMLTHSGNPSRYERLYPSCYNHPLTDPRCRPNQERFVPALKGWRERSSRMGIYEYYCKASVCQAAFPIVHTIREDIPYYHKLGVEYFYTQGSWRNSGMIGLNYYVAAKLLWDVHTDVDALLADFYARFYRESAEPMRRYHEMMEQAMAERGGDVLGWLFFTTKVYEDSLVGRLRHHLDEAEAAARSDVVRARIGLARATLDYTALVKTLWGELESGYAKLMDPNADRSRQNEVLRALAQRIKPYQEAVTRFCESQKALQWMNASRNNYRERLLGEQAAFVYHSLLPPPRCSSQP